MGLWEAPGTRWLPATNLAVPDMGHTRPSITLAPFRWRDCVEGCNSLARIVADRPSSDTRTTGCSRQWNE